MFAVRVVMVPATVGRKELTMSPLPLHHDGRCDVQAVLVQGHFCGHLQMALPTRQPFLALLPDFAA